MLLNKPFSHEKLEVQFAIFHLNGIPSKIFSFFSEFLLAHLLTKMKEITIACFQIWRQISENIMGSICKRTYHVPNVTEGDFRKFNINAK